MTIDEWNKRLFRDEGKLSRNERGEVTSQLWQELELCGWRISDGEMQNAEGEVMFTGTRLDMLGMLSVRFETKVLESLYGRL